MLAPTQPPRMITHSQSMPLRGKLLLALMVIGVMIVAAVFLSFVTETPLLLEEYVRDQLAFSRLISFIGTPASSCFV